MEGQNVGRVVHLILPNPRAELLVMGLEQVTVSLKEVLDRFRGHSSMGKSPAADLSPVQDLRQLAFVL